MTQVSEALDRIRAAVATRTAAAVPMPPAPPANAPADPVAPALDATTAPDSQITDLQETVASLADRVSALEQAGIDDAMEDLTGWADDDAFTAGLPEAKTAAPMATSAVDDLPDSSFAYVEPGGTTDGSGKTIPRAKRHFPIHDAAHVRDALSRAPQSPFGDKAKPKIDAAAKKFGVDKGS